jgi:transposase
MRNGKKLYSSAFKAWIVEQAFRPGVSVSNLAMRHGINANQLRRWMRLQHWREASSAASASTAPVVLPVTIAEPLPAPPNLAIDRPVAPAIEIELAGAIVRVTHGVDAQQLRIVLQALRA